jgi:UDP-N-acetylmuramoylalanine--D-glutamate ligase
MGAEKLAMQPKGHALVVGIGKTGLSCVPFLLRLGYSVEVMDTRQEPPMLADLRRSYPDLPVHTGGLDPRRLRQADLLVVSPGISVHTPEIAGAGVEIVGDIELFARSAQAPVLAITGSNGKSTVTAMLGHILARLGYDARVGGNIGVPALELIQAREPDVYVLELSSFQLETTHSLHARAATVLNVSADHMDRYDTLDAYAGAKQRIFAGDGVMVLNADDPAVMAMAQADREIVRFTLNEPAGERDYGVLVHADEAWLARGEQELVPVRSLKISGRHNIANALAAIALAEAAGAGPIEAAEAAAGFPGLPHRCHVVAEAESVRWIDDSKGTNVGATHAALAGMDRPVVWIAGGEGKDADFAELRAVVSEHVRAAVLIGRDAPLIERALQGVVPVYRAGDMDDAVRQARGLARPGDVVLLSPACASFDMFRNYEHRGEVFAQTVREQVTP